MVKNKTITIFYPYTHATINKVEKWLRKKANSGWRLIEEKHCLFTFRECTPYDGCFLMHYDFGAERVLGSEFLSIKERCGLSNSKSELNKTPQYIFEIDKTKPNNEIVGFKVKRNRYYKKHYGSFSILFGIPLLFLIIACFYQKEILFLLCPLLIIFLYCLLSFILLSKNEHS